MCGVPYLGQWGWENTRSTAVGFGLGFGRVCVRSHGEVPSSQYPLAQDGVHARQQRPGNLQVGGAGKRRLGQGKQRSRLRGPGTQSSPLGRQVSDAALACEHVHDRRLVRVAPVGRVGLSRCLNRQVGHPLSTFTAHVLITLWCTVHTPAPAAARPWRTARPGPPPSCGPPPHWTPSGRSRGPRLGLDIDGGMTFSGVGYQAQRRHASGRRRRAGVQVQWAEAEPAPGGSTGWRGAAEGRCDM